ncbi:MAG: bacillithiol system redox-active protein YtxJ [Flavobacteriales bacterium]|nr:bacillithiol system redox-active protein YtxJ [Flavobacteriales bacterium]
MNWINLTTMSELDKIKEDSYQNPQFIFKHSTRCYISKMVLSRFESTNYSASLSVYLLDLLNYRDLSSQIADDFNVKHESPQLLVIKDDECYKHSAHTTIHQLNLFE